jgi:hypothetical protein
MRLLQFSAFGARSDAIASPDELPILTQPDGWLGVDMRDVGIGSLTEFSMWVCLQNATLLCGNIGNRRLQQGLLHIV